VILAIVLTIFTNYLNGWKVSLILKSPLLSINKLTNINFISTFFNNILPTRFGGDIIRIFYISKDLPSKEIGFFAVVFDRMTGILFKSSLCCFPALFYLENILMYG